MPLDTGPTVTVAKQNASNEEFMTPRLGHRCLLETTVCSRDMRRIHPVSKETEQVHHPRLGKTGEIRRVVFQGGMHKIDMPRIGDFVF